MSDPQQEAVVVELSGDLVIRCVDEFTTQLRGALADEAAVEIEAGEVTRADGAALQILASAFATWSARDARISWKSISPALRRDAETAGMAAALALEEEGR